MSGTGIYPSLGSGGGSVSFPLLAPNGSAPAPSYSWVTAASSGLYSNGAGDTLVSNGGNFAFGTFSSGSYVLDSKLFGFINAALTTVDVALARNAAGLMEVNNGTAGTFRDLVARTYFGQSSNSAASAYSFTGNTTFGFSFDSFFGPSAYGTGGLAMAFGGNINFPLIVGSGAFVSWATGPLVPGGGGFAKDVGLGRASAGVLCVNDSASLSAFRDLVVRNQFFGGTSVTEPRLNQFGAGSLFLVCKTGTGSAYAYLGAAAIAALSTADTIHVALNDSASGLSANSGLIVGSADSVFFNSAAAVNSGSPDISLARLAAASLRQGLAPSATPIAQTLTVGESSRPGTDSDVGGADGTLRTGLGTGIGTTSHLVFQCSATVAPGTTQQTYATYLDLGAGTAYIPAVVRFSSGGQWDSGSGDYGLYASSLAVALGSTTTFGWSSASNAAAATADIQLARFAANSLQQGKAPSGAPAAQTFTLGEASRPGTDSNVGGSSGTFRSGLGTGAGVTSSLIFMTPTAAVPGSTAQTYASRMTIVANGVSVTVPFNGVTMTLSGTTSSVINFSGAVDGAGGSAGTLTNAPSVGNPAFWLPIQIGGATRYIPCWA